MTSRFLLRLPLRLPSRGSLLATLAALVAASGSACNSDLSRRSLAGSRPAFVVEAISPADGADGVPRTGVIELVVSAPLDRTAFENDADGLDAFVRIERLGAMDVLVAGEFSLEDGDTRIVFTPSAPLDVPLFTYRITVLEGLTNLDGDALDIDGGGSVPLPSLFTTEDFQDVIPPEFEGITTLQSVSSSALRATWDLASDDFSPVNEIVYRVYRNDPPNGEPDIDYGAPILETQPEVLDVLVSGLEQDTEYTVGVRAVDGFGNESLNLETLTARTEAIPDFDAPAFNGVAELIAMAPDTIVVNWAPASDDRDDETDIRYRVFLGDAAPLDFATPLLTTAGGASEATVTGLDSDTEYFVAVRAVDTSDNEDENTSTLSVTTLVSFADDIFPIFSSPAVGGCIRSFCHARGNSGGRLSLETYEDLIAGGRTPSPPAIVPGDPEGSFLVWRTDESNPNFRGPRMPSGRPALDDAILDVIRRWIAQGAENN